MGREVKDWDIEVYGLDARALSGRYEPWVP